MEETTEGFKPLAVSAVAVKRRYSPPFFQLQNRKSKSSFALEVMADLHLILAGIESGPATPKMIGHDVPTAVTTDSDHIEHSRVTEPKPFPGQARSEEFSLPAAAVATTTQLPGDWRMGATF